MIVINIITEILNSGIMVLTEQVISNDKQIKAVKLVFEGMTSTVRRVILYLQNLNYNLIFIGFCFLSVNILFIFVSYFIDFIFTT